MKRGAEHSPRYCFSSSSKSKRSFSVSARCMNLGMEERGPRGVLHVTSCVYYWGKNLFLTNTIKCMGLQEMYTFSYHNIKSTPSPL